MSTITMPTSAVAIKTGRIQSIDLLRGTVMIIMALDHIRDYFHGSAFYFDPTDLNRTSVAIFFTRWITHFCAPVFMFLAGTSAYLYGAKKSRKELSIFLFTRGLWLIFLEFTVLHFAWLFNYHYPIVDIIIIWALGVSMIALAILVYLPKQYILLIALLIIFGHNLLDSVHVPGNNLRSFLWALLHEENVFMYHGITIFVGYPVLPWIGVMAAGYCLGQIYVPGFDPVRRKKILTSLGLGAIAVFIIVRFSNLYGDLNHWSFQKNSVFTILSFLKTTKYPPSLLYILMTLGPALLFLAFSEKPLNSITSKISVFGRVPFFYYILHIYLIHFLAVIAVVLSGRKWTDMILSTWLGFDDHLKGYGFSLAVVYMVWAIVIISLYPLCKWYDNYKRTHIAQKRWLSYL